ncbi:DUF1572 family protein [Chengkuizengella axinellae]|uniref:DUF1572 family protein n=1 Tax=Chengkuizengella axinellae TaxID=3064388 RepID=A0ABT9IXZ0_9BACL|nr:DUF1572 family protein [Chengkuizengella sp. 2205SS18-9]MDP5274108.1 DUF1572 family protein [Chengkuizengella sp. 2205SS18-9]
MSSIGKLYLETVLHNFEGMKLLGEKSITQVKEEQINFSENEDSNSIAIIVKHLNGNMKSRWENFLASDGESTGRDRDQEFEGKIDTKEELLSVWNEGWAFVFDAIRDLNESDLNKTITIRSQSLSVLQAIQRQISHYSYHIGQIVYISKQLSDSWNSLSIPRGQSKEFNKQMMNRNKN